MPALPDLSQATALAGPSPDATVTAGQGGGGAIPGPLAAAERYALGEEIARGGMGAVYRADDAVLGREVAVKVLLGEPGASALARFADEARITARLQHPSIPPVHDLGTLPDGRPFLAMKLIRGETLEKRLKDRPDPSADRGRHLAAFEQVCQALGYAHANGVIHRDLKPANVMVGAFGETQVMDWGLARQMRVAEWGMRNDADGGPADSSNGESGDLIPHSTLRNPQYGLTQAGQVMGTPAYMPPEQARGETDRVDARSDVFALGGVLCRILTGKPPHTGGVADVLRQAARGVAAETGARLDGCGADTELVALCRRCLATEPADRPADGGEVARLVAEYRAGVERRMRDAERDRVAAEARAVELRKRRRVQWAVAGLAAALAVGAAGFVWWQGWQDGQAKVREAQASAEQTRLEGEKKLVEEREAATAREKQARNGDAIEVHVGRCEAALTADNAPAAADALAEIDRRRPDGGGEALAGRIDRCRAEHTMLLALDRIDSDRWGVGEGRRADAAGRIGQACAAAFAAYGIVPGRTPPAEAAEVVAAAHIRDRLLSALDLWLLYDPTTPVRELLERVDSDPFRGGLRDTLISRSGDRMRALVAEPEFLAQPPRFAVPFGAFTPAPAARRQALLETVVRRHPDRFQAHMALAATYRINAPDTAEARRRCYTAAAALRPNHAVVLNNLGVALKDAGLEDAAVAAYERSIALDPTYPPPHSNLGAALAGRGKLEDAIPHFREAVRLDPKLAFAHYNLGLALQKTGDAEGGLASFRDAVTADPKFATGHTALGNAYARKEDWKAAAASFRTAAELDAKNPKAHANLAAVLAKLEDFAGAVAALEAAVELDPQFADRLAAAKKVLADKK